MDIIALLNSKNIEFIDRGSNVKQGNVNIACPLCKDDPSHHLGIELSTGKWACWRDSKHRGSSIFKLLKTLGFTGFELATLKNNNEYIQLDDWMSSINQLTNPVEVPVKLVKKLELLPEFKEIRKQGVFGRFWNYLEYRGFNNPQEIIDRWKLKACLTGYWKDRVIAPVMQNGNLMTWVGRAISDSERRYQALQGEKSVASIKQLLYNYDDIKYGGHTLFITEGVFDCINLTQHLPDSHKVTCLFSLIMTIEQQILISEISPKFKIIKILLDNTAESEAIEIKEELSYLKKVEVQLLPQGVKDPGELNSNQIKYLLN